MRRHRLPSWTRWRRPSRRHVLSMLSQEPRTSAATIHPLPSCQASLASLVQCRMRAAPRSQARGAVPKGLRVERCEPHRYRALDDLLLARGCADGALSPVFLLAPDALDGRGLGASVAQTRRQIAPRLVKVCGLGRRCDPVNARGTGLARVPVDLPQHGLLDQGGQGRAYPRRVAGRLCRKALQLWGDGWGSHGLSRRSLQLHVMPGVACRVEHWRAPL